MPDGKRPLVANTFGLPSGKSFSCPGATSVCEKICYAGKLEKIFKGTRELLLANWDAVQNKSVNELQQMIQFMIQDFKYDCDKYNAEKLFRIHWDGDFFSEITQRHGVELLNITKTYSSGCTQGYLVQ